ncbi:MAG: hypothetical protein ABGX63_00170 [bacterium]
MSQVLKLISVMLIGIVLVAATCSSDEKSKDDTTLLEQVDPFFKTQAENTLLTLADLPRNWISEPYEVVGFSADFSDECKILDDDTDTDSSYTVNSDDFSGPNGDSVSNTIQIFSLCLEATAIMNDLDLAMDRCLGELEEVFENCLEEDGIDARIRYSELIITGFGATSKGIRLTMTIPLVGTIMVHHERMVSSLTYAYPVGTSPDSDSNALVAGLLNVIINRLEQAHQ